MSESNVEESGVANTVSMAANIPPPSPMSFTGDCSAHWDVFRAKYEDYILVTGIAEKDKKIQAATLCSVMSNECRHVSLTAEQREDPAAIMSALESYFKPAKNIIYERYLFGCCKQEESESLDAFVTKLREKASTCEYTQLKDEMIRDKIVLGIASESTRRRLLREKDLSMKSKQSITTGRVLCMDGNSGPGSDEESTLYMIESVGAVGQTKGKKWFVTLKLNNKPQRCQLDSGATYNIMTLKHVEKWHPKQSYNKAMPA